MQSSPSGILQPPTLPPLRDLDRPWRVRLIAGPPDLSYLASHMLTTAFAKRTHWRGGYRRQLPTHRILARLNREAVPSANPTIIAGLLRNSPRRLSWLNYCSRAA